MPYILQNERREYEPKQINTYVGPGQLNFSITSLIMLYQQDKGLSYQTINDIIGALEGAKQEYYRRVAIPYEDTKLTTNGDVYGQT